MKSILTIAAIAVLMVFAVSCSPDVSTTGINYEERNVNNRPENIGGSYFSQVIPNGFDSVDNAITAGKENPRITFKIPKAADIHKGFTEAKLKEFLSFYEFTNSDESAVINKGLASTLSTTSINYELVNRAGESVTVELKKTFPNTGTVSHVVAKIDSTKYTYLSGIKLDRDNDGIEGVADYDDHFEEISVSNATITTFSRPEQKNWYINLNSARAVVVPAGQDQWSTPSATTTSSVSLHLTVPFILSNTAGNPAGANPINTGTTEGKAIYKEIGDKVAAGMKLQKLVGDTWTDVKTAVYEASLDGAPINTNDRLLFKDVILDHRVLYRIAWNGGKIITDGVYFGVKQKVYVDGTRNNIGLDLAKPTDRFNRTYVMSASNIVFTNSGMDFSEVLNIATDTDSLNLGTGASGYGITYTALAANNGRIRVRIEVPIRGNGNATNPYVGLSDITLDEFKKSFKFVFRKSGDLANASDLFTNPNVVEIGVDHIRLAKEGNMFDTNGYTLVPNTMTNVIYVYLDPTFNLDLGLNGGNTTQLIYYKIFMNKGIRYTKGSDATSPERVFGDWTEYLYGGFRIYN